MMPDNKGITYKDVAQLWVMNIEELKRLSTYFQEDMINDNFHRKNMVRNLFSVIEGYLFMTRELIKLIIIYNPITNYGITFHEIIALHGKAISIDKNGQVVGKETFHPFESTLRFTLNCFAKMFKSPQPNYGDNGYAKLIRLSKRRNDLTHPKSAALQIVSDDEMKDLALGLEWFIRTHGETSIKVNFEELFLKIPPSNS